MLCAAHATLNWNYDRIQHSASAWAHVHAHTPVLAGLDFRCSAAQISCPWLVRQLSQREQLVGVHCTPHTGPGCTTPQHHAQAWRTAPEGSSVRMDRLLP